MIFRPSPIPVMDISRSRTDREYLQLEREILQLLQGLEKRSSKTVGKEYSERIRRLSILGNRLPGELNFEERRAVFRLSNITTREPRLSAIQSLHKMLEIISRSRADFSERRTRLLEKEIEDLQEQIDQLSAEYEDDDVSEKTEKSEKPNVAAENAVFVIMPFASDFNDVWKGGIRKDCEEGGFLPIRIDEINRSSNITDDIIDAIASCRIAIVDVTDNNPNVMFELGYTLSAKKPHIIISQSTDFLPFDIRNIRTIEYTNSWSGIETLREQLIEYLKEHKPNKKPKAKSKPTTKKKARTKTSVPR